MNSRLESLSSASLGDALNRETWKWIDMSMRLGLTRLLLALDFERNLPLSRVWHTPVGSWRLVVNSSASKAVLEILGHAKAPNCTWPCSYRMLITTNYVSLCTGKA